MKKSYDEQSRNWTWTFANLGNVVFTVPQTYPGDNAEGSQLTIDEALVFGYGESIGNAAAIARDTKTGASASESEKREAILARIATIEGGQWRAKAGRTATLVDVDVLVTVICEATGKSVEGVTKFVTSRDENGRKVLAEDDRFKVEYAVAMVGKKVAKPMDVTLGAELDKVE